MCWLCLSLAFVLLAAFCAKAIRSSQLKSDDEKYAKQLDKMYPEDGYGYDPEDLVTHYKLNEDHK